MDTENREYDYQDQANDYRLIEKAIQYLEANYPIQPSLKEVAASVNLSEYHFQRLFTRWVGISPKRFLQYLTKQHARELLERSGNLLDVAYETGLSGPGRLHDLFVTWEAVTPGEYKNRGEGIEMLYGIHPTPFGDCLLAKTPRGVCSLVFIQDEDSDRALAELRRRWEKAVLRQDQESTRKELKRVFSFLGGGDPSGLSIYVSGTPFQIKVWEALLRVPSGAVVTYEDLAVQIGLPGRARAVGNAVGNNPIPVLIPCHRVIRGDGDFGGYRWGMARKKALLGWEMARSSESFSETPVLQAG